MKTSEPTISVIVNTTDRAKQLCTLLKALSQQSYGAFEVVVVVGPTKDDTLLSLEPCKDRIRLLRCPKANLSQSRNIGLLAARGDFVAYIDDDAVPSYRWLEQIAMLFLDSQLDGTGGIVYSAYPDDRLHDVQFRIGLISALFEQVDVRASRLDHIVHSGGSSQWVDRMMGTNMAYRRTALLEIGGFDEFHVWVADEADVAMRMAEAGKLVWPVPEAAVYHLPASSRNRVVFTYRGRWWLQTRSGVYHTIKCGPRAGDSWAMVLKRCLELVHGHWIWSQRLHREGHLPWLGMWKMRIDELHALLSGGTAGLLKRRRLIPPRQIQAALRVSEPLVPYRTESESKPVAINPITGHERQASSPGEALRICLLSYKYPPADYDGVGRLTNLMARGLFESGHVVHVITSGERERVSFYDGAYVHEVPLQPSRYDRYRRIPRTYQGLNSSHAVFQKVRSLVLNEGIQIVDSPLWLYPGLVTAVSRMLPVVVRLVTATRQVARIQGERDMDSRMMGEMERLLIESADLLLPNTLATLTGVNAIYGLSIPCSRYTVVPYGIVPASECDVATYSTGTRERPKRVLFVGRLEKRKGILDLFEAIPRVTSRVRDVEFVVVGYDNSMHDGFANRHGVDYPTFFRAKYPTCTDRVEFAGAVSDEELQALYRGCDLFVAPSLYESFGLVYLEAMNYAKPVVGCRAGGVPEVIDDGITGVLVEPGAPEQLADTIIELLGNPSRMRALGLAGRAQVLNRFSYLNMALNYAAAYRSVIAGFAAGKGTLGEEVS